MCPLEREERSKQKDKCRCGKSRKDAPLQAQRFPEYFSVAERTEPEHIDVIGQRRLSAEENSGENCENNKEAPSASRRMPRKRRRPVDGFRHYSAPFFMRRDSLK